MAIARFSIATNEQIFNPSTNEKKIRAEWHRVIAWGKLSGTYKFRLFQGAPVSFAGQHLLNLVLGLAMLGLTG